jgi:hypothetical protein
LALKTSLGTVTLTLELTREEAEKLKILPRDAFQPFRTAEGHLLLKNLSLEEREGTTTHQLRRAEDHDSNRL